MMNCALARYNPLQVMIRHQAALLSGKRTRVMSGVISRYRKSLCLDRFRAVIGIKNIMSDKQCIFCAIIAKAAPGFIVYENPHAVVFLDRYPINVGHLLIVPKHHVEAFYELAEHSFIALMLVVKRMASLIEAMYQPKQVGMLAAGFDVAHAHLHVLPLYDAHDITAKVILEGKRAHPTEEDLRMTAERIERGLQAQGGGRG